MIYAFENFALDTDLFELRRDGATVPVEPQVFELLVFLVERRDRVASRDEIFEHVWKGRFVSDSALSSRIKAARRALDDDGEAQRLIRTIQRRGFRFVGEAREATTAAPPPAALAGALVAAPSAQRADGLVAEIMGRPAVAVLPFADATDGAGSSYLADGVTDEVTAALCAWRSYPVISRNTAFRHRASDLAAPELGRALGARYLLEGVLQRGDDRVKLTASLIDAEEDRTMWSGRIVRPLDEAFTLQEELAQTVMAMLEPEMRAAEMRRIERKPPGDWTAWDLAMRATWCANRSAEAEWDEAVRLAEAAAERAPDWYLPYALIAFVRFQRAMRNFSAADARTAFAATLEAARHALAVDPGSWLAHALTAVGELWVHGHHDRALDHVHRALELNPSACWTYHFGGCIRGFAGDLPAARRCQDRIFRIDPAYPYTAVIHSDLGLWRMLEGDLDAAADHLARAEQWDPAYGRALQRQVALGGLRGDRAASGRAIARLAEIGAPLGREQILTSYPFREARHRELFFDGFRRAGVNL